MFDLLTTIPKAKPAQPAAKAEVVVNQTDTQSSKDDKPSFDDVITKQHTADNDKPKQKKNENNRQPETQSKPNQLTDSSANPETVDNTDHTTQNVEVAPAEPQTQQHMPDDIKTEPPLHLGLSQTQLQDQIILPQTVVETTQPDLLATEDTPQLTQNTSAANLAESEISAAAPQQPAQQADVDTDISQQPEVHTALTQPEMDSSDNHTQQSIEVVQDKAPVLTGEPAQVLKAPESEPEMVRQVPAGAAAETPTPLETTTATPAAVIQQVTSTKEPVKAPERPAPQAISKPALKTEKSANNLADNIPEPALDALPEIAIDAQPAESNTSTNQDQPTDTTPQEQDITPSLDNTPETTTENIPTQINLTQQPAQTDSKPDSKYDNRYDAPSTPNTANADKPAASPLGGQPQQPLQTNPVTTPAMQAALPDAVMPESFQDVLNQPSTSDQTPEFEQLKQQSVQTQAVDASKLAKAAQSMPTPPAAAVEQVSLQIRKALDENEQRIRIKLQPVSLGNVEIQMEMNEDGRIQAVIASEKIETYDWLQKDRSALERALEQAGIEMDSGSLEFEFSGNQNQNNDRDQDNGQPVMDATISLISNDNKPTSYHSGDMDIRI